MRIAPWVVAGLFAVPAPPPSPIVSSEFIYLTAPFPSAHASTIVETDRGLVAAWFGGTAEGNADVGIWLSRRGPAGWSPPVEVATGRQPDGTRLPCWNPVLFQPRQGPLLLFYKVGPEPRRWWGMVRTSADNGHTWSAAVRLPPGILGPIRAKPVELQLELLLAGSSTEGSGWLTHLERLALPRGWNAATLGARGAWHATGPLNDTAQFSAIQPTILMHSATRVQILCRTRNGVISESWSEDGGLTWGPMRATSLPNPNSGIDALRLRDGRFLLVYNPLTQDRHQLAIAISADGEAWHQVAMLENSPGEYSYPAMIQTQDGLVHVTYTWRRERIKYVVLAPERMGPL